MRGSSIVLVLVLVLVLCGCGGGRKVSEGKLSDLVLKPSDMHGYDQFSSGPQVTLDNQGTSRSNPARFGREGGWIVRYQRSNPQVTDGPLVVESRADLFPSAEKATADLNLYGRDFNRAVGAERLKPPALGDKAIAIVASGLGLRPTRIYRIAWRDLNVTASVRVQGYADKMSFSDALRLARRQDERIRRAAG